MSNNIYANQSDAINAEHNAWQDRLNEWMHKVDRALLKRCGLTSRDLADQCYADWFDDGMSPAEAAELVLEDEGFSE
jgi:Family of unknown function (DUF5419)